MRTTRILRWRVARPGSSTSWWLTSMALSPERAPKYQAAAAGTPCGASHCEPPHLADHGAWRQHVLEHLLSQVGCQEGTVVRVEQVHGLCACSRCEPASVAYATVMHAIVAGSWSARVWAGSAHTHGLGVTSSPAPRRCQRCPAQRPCHHSPRPQAPALQASCSLHAQTATPRQADRSAGDVGVRLHLGLHGCMLCAASQRGCTICRAANHAATKRPAAA
eukprot:278381-Chlamydomonas_euryale.AAC.10